MKKKFQKKDFISTFLKDKRRIPYLLHTLRIIKNDEKAIQDLICCFEKELKSFKSIFIDVFLGSIKSKYDIKDFDPGHIKIDRFFFDKDLYYQSYIYLFEHQKDEIKFFLTLRHSFENNLIYGNYEECEKILIQIEDRFGYSIWLIENRFNLANFSSINNDKVWSYRNNLFKILDEKRNDFLLIFSDIFSFKSEKNFSIIKLRSLQQKYIDDFFEKGKSSSEFLNYSVFHFDSINYDQIDKPEYLFLFSQYTSLIDKYLLFQNTIKFDYVNNNEVNISNQRLKSLVYDINDFELFTVIKLITKDENILIESTVITEITIAFYKNNFDLVIKKSIEYLTEKKKFNIEVLIYFAKSLVKSECKVSSELSEILNNTLAGNILMSLYSVYSKNSKNDDDYLSLLSLSTIFGLSKLGIGVYKAFNDNIEWLPDFDVNKLFYINSCSNFNPKYPELNLEYKLLSDQLQSKVFNSDEIDQKLSMLDLNPLDKSILFTKKFRNLISNNDYSSAIKLYIKYNLENAELTRKIDIIQFKNLIIENSKDIDNTFIEYPIFCYLSDFENNKIKLASEKFLRSKKCKKPSDFINIIETEAYDINDQLLENFLYFTCSIDVLKYSIYYKTINDVYKERIYILQYLLTFSKKNLAKYSNEISLLTKKMQIQKTISELDSGKIYVNKDKIHKLTIGEINSLVKKISVKKQNVEIKKEFLRLNEIDKYKKTNSFYNLSVDAETGYMCIYVINEYTIKRNELFKILRDLYVYDEEYGLNSYLSTKIRHGTLPNHLRNVFEKQDLVTTIYKSNYTDNNIINEIIDIDPEDKIEIQNFFKEFSQKIDDYIFDIKNKFIQCKTETNDEKSLGLFNFKFTDNEIDHIFLDKEQEDYDSFYNFIMNNLDKKLDESLYGIKNYFIYVAQEDFLNFIEDLKQKLINHKSYSKLKHVIPRLERAKTDIQAQIKMINKWFSKTENNYKEDLDLSLLIETSIEIIKNIHPKSSLFFELDNNNKLLVNGKMHNYLIDFIVICLDNIIKHSDIEFENIKPKITINLDSQILKFGFENNFNDNLYLTIDKKLEKVKNNWLKLDENISKEDGTGLPKIKKIFFSDLEIIDSFFDYKLENNRLRLNFNFSLNSIIYENPNN